MPEVGILGYHRRRRGQKLKLVKKSRETCQMLESTVKCEEMLQVLESLRRLSTELHKLVINYTRWEHLLNINIREKVLNPRHLEYIEATRGGILVFTIVGTMVFNHPSGRNSLLF